LKEEIESASCNKQAHQVSAQRSCEARININMCFRTDIADPTQQPIRISQSTEARDTNDHNETYNRATEQNGRRKKKVQDRVTGDYQEQNGGDMTNLRKTSSAEAQTYRSIQNQRAKEQNIGSVMMHGLQRDF